MQTVLGEQLRTGLAILPEQGFGHVEVYEPAVLLTEPLYQLVGLLLGIYQFPACEARLDRQEDDPRLWQFLVDNLHQLLKIGVNLFGRLLGCNVIVPGVEHDQTRCVLQNELRSEVNRVGDLRATEATIDGGQIRERFLQVPHPNAGTADE